MEAWGHHVVEGAPWGQIVDEAVHKLYKQCQKHAKSVTEVYVLYVS